MFGTIIFLNIFLKSLYFPVKNLSTSNHLMDLKQNSQFVWDIDYINGPKFSCFPGSMALTLPSHNDSGFGHVSEAEL